MEPVDYLYARMAASDNMTPGDPNLPVILTPGDRSETFKPGKDLDKYSGDAHSNGALPPELMMPEGAHDL